MRTDRITAQHLRRATIVYVRQSSPEQVRSHAESTFTHAAIALPVHLITLNTPPPFSTCREFSQARPEGKDGGSSSCPTAVTELHPVSRLLAALGLPPEPLPGRAIPTE
jgi:hypothetical protein